MYFVGLDLAWGQVQPTGIAVVDDSGQLIEIGLCVTDGEIKQIIAPYVQGDCLVAIDAPLIVKNESGQRPCETAITRVYGAFHAGAHSSSLKSEWFRPLPRGARLGTDLQLAIDPTSRGPRRAIEVFPHPAIVALFRLGRTLKYKDKQPKNGPPRTLDDLRPELRRLMDLVETELSTGLVRLSVAEHPDWNRLRAAVDTASTKAALGRAEDQVDAVLCAYIALFSQRQPDCVDIFGDVETGYIVTPRLPPGLLPGPSAAATTPKPAPSGESAKRLTDTAVSDEQCRLQSLAYDLLSSSWPGLDNSTRSAIVRLLASNDYHSALRYLLDSTAELDTHFATAARIELDATGMTDG